MSGQAVLQAPTRHGTGTWAPEHSTRGGGLQRVVIIDDDDINRRGIASLLTESTLIEVDDVLAHHDALHRTKWAGVTTVLVDAVDKRRTDDQFAGVSVVEHLRRHTNPADTSVVVTTEHYYDDALRRRMTEARADAFYDRAELADANTLRDIILSPPWTRRTVPPAQAPDDQFCHGVTASTRVNQAVAYALAHDLHNQLTRRAQPRSRYWLRLRQDFNTHARLYPVTADGCEPDREQNLPSLPQITRFLTWATKIKPSTNNAAS